MCAFSLAFSLLKASARDSCPYFKSSSSSCPADEVVSCSVQSTSIDANFGISNCYSYFPALNPSGKLSTLQFNNEGKHGDERLLIWILEREGGMTNLKLTYFCKLVSDFSSLLGSSSLIKSSCWWWYSGIVSSECIRGISKRLDPNDLPEQLLWLVEKSRAALLWSSLMSVSMLLR